MTVTHFNDEILYNNLKGEDRFKVNLLIVLGHSLAFSLFRYPDYMV